MDTERGVYDRKSNKKMSENGKPSPRGEEELKHTKSHKGRYLDILEGMNTYRLKIMMYFFALMGICVVGRMVLFMMFDDVEYDVYYKNRMDMINNEKSILSIIYTMYIYQTTTIGMGLIDFTIQAVCIVTVLTYVEQQRVQQAQKEIQLIVSTTKREDLMNPSNMKRKFIIENHNKINNILGCKNFRVKIMKLEFLKECLTLDYITIALLYAAKSILRLYNIPYFTSLDLLSDSCLVSFINYKNIVYINTRLTERAELNYRRIMSTIVYSIYFTIKLYHLLNVIYIMNNVIVSISCIIFSYLIYLISDRINDIRIINNIRIYIYFILYSQK